MGLGVPSGRKIDGISGCFVFGKVFENTAFKTCIQNLIAMKKALYFLLAAGMVVAGCSREDLFSWTTDSDNPATSGVEGSTTATVTEDGDDNIAKTTFDRTISIVFSDSGNATVEGDANGIVKINGNSVTANNTSTSEKVKYILSGSTSNGFFKVYSNNKQAFVLDGVSITNPNGAAINNQGKKRCFVVVNGTNSLADGITYNTPDEEDEKAAFFSEGQLIFSGDGKADTDGLVARIGAEDNTVGLALKSDGPLIKKTEKLAADMDKLISDVKKRGLKINVDIF